MNLTKLLSLSLFFLASSLLECKGLAKSSNHRIEHKNKKLSLVYHPDYNIQGFEQYHFDACKYGKVYNYLASKKNLASSIEFHQPTEVTDKELRTIHPQNYLDSLKDPQVMKDFLGDIEISPESGHRIRNAMRLATGGTILATKLALQSGYAINLGGGYHHAKAEKAEGHCAYADIPLAINFVLKENPKLKRALIIDLDAHQGNGHECIFRDNHNIAIFDIYNEDQFPHDEAAKDGITYDYPVSNGTATSQYLSLLKQNLPLAIDHSNPDFIVYNAGTDILTGDTNGCLNVSEQGIIERDAFVFTEAIKRNIPITMVLSGGYTDQSAIVIRKSIENLLTNIINPKKSSFLSLTTLAIAGGVAAAGSIAAYFYTTSKPTDSTIINNILEDNKKSPKKEISSENK